MNSSPDPAETPSEADAAQAAWSPTRLYQAYLMGVVLLIAISSQLDQRILSVMQEVIKADLRLTDLQLGLIAGPAFVLFYSVAGIPLARLAERVNRPALLGVCVAIWSATTMLCGSAQSALQLALARVGVGTAEGGNAPIGVSFVADFFSLRRRGMMMSIHTLAAPIAAIIAPVVGGVVAHTWGWRVAFFVIGAPGLVLALLSATTLKEPRRARLATAPKVGSFLAAVRWLFSDRAFVFVFLAGAFNGVGIQGTAIFSASFVMREHGLNVAAAGVVIGALGAAKIAATFIGGWFADRFTDDRGRSYVLIPALGAALSFVFFLVSFNAASWPLAVGCLFVANFATDLKNGPNQAAVQNIVPSHMRATAAAVFMLAAAVVGMAGGATLVGAVSDMAAANHFGQSFGRFASVCPGGHAAAATPHAMKAACNIASAFGLRVGLTVVSFSFLGAMLCFYLASRTIEVNHD